MSRLYRIPAILPMPLRRLEAVLYREQPGADDQGERNDRQLNQHHPASAESENEGRQHHQEHDIGRLHARPLPPQDEGASNGNR